MVPVTPPARNSRKNLLGSGKGKIWYSDNWDSDETNLSIQKLFEGSDSDDPL